MCAGEGCQQPRRHIYHCCQTRRRRRQRREQRWSGDTQWRGEGGKWAFQKKKKRDLMCTCKLMTAEGINLALENWCGVQRVDKSSGRLWVLPVVIDICGIPCRQKEVHKEDDRCTVRRGSVLVCKTEDSSEAQMGQKQQERRMTLERAAARCVGAWSLMTEVQTGGPIAASYCNMGSAAQSHWVEWWISWIIHTLEDGLTVIVLAKCCDD